MSAKHKLLKVSLGDEGEYMAKFPDCERPLTEALDLMSQQGWNIASLIPLSFVSAPFDESLNFNMSGKVKGFRMTEMFVLLKIDQAS